MAARFCRALAAGGAVSVLCACNHCPTREHRIKADDPTAGITPDDLLAAVRQRDVLRAGVSSWDTEANSTGPSDADNALIDAGPYTVSLLDGDVRDARLRTQHRSGDHCGAEETLRIPIRIRVQSADGTIDLRTWSFVTAAEGVRIFDSELDPDEAEVEGRAGPVLGGAIREAEASSRRTTSCPDEPGEPLLRMHYTGFVGGTRSLSFDVTFQDFGCIQSVHSVADLSLEPTG